ncbi:hypothetical protein HYFRA_00001672 [Hymenoscyphus fraxineus]|uniref:Cytochrome P450 n=1 Tax=Hymenoscyphus fraxineus TaxID=746836 RepID=A0A9N9PXW3_9HELO|nr:hypothetical protein HYFRA_00001672 [Hymenoscyphus fraxineus]
MAIHNNLLALGVLAFIGLNYLVLEVYRHRSLVNRLRKQGVCVVPGWSWVTGHLLVFARYTRKFPRDITMAVIMNEMCLEFPKTETFILDLWPFMNVAIMTYNAEAGLFVTSKYNLPKSPTTLATVKPIAGGPNILTMNGSDWKYWRSLLNPGFSAASLVDHTSFIVDSVNVFCRSLEEKAEKGIILLDDHAVKLTFDVIMKVVMDADINYQTSDHPFAIALANTGHEPSVFEARKWNPLRPIREWYNGYKMQNFVTKSVRKRFEEIKLERLVSSNKKRTSKAKSVVGMTLDSYFDEMSSKQGLEGVELAPGFLNVVAYQTRMFLLAGNDTTSSTIVLIYNTIARNPEVAAQLRQEHETVFGPDVSTIGTQLKAKPALLNDCRYTLAVIKETLRLYPPVPINMRAGLPNVSIQTLDGDKVPTEGCSIMVQPYAMQINPRIWVRPKEFLPERWLVSSDHELYPPPNAYRPFDVGPRACIGQQLTLNEMRIVIIMTMRRFNIKPAYDEFDELARKNLGPLGKLKRGIFGEGIKTFDGDRAYQTVRTGSHPSDGYPCRIEVLKS